MSWRPIAACGDSPAGEAPVDSLKFYLDRPVPETLVVGNGTAFFLSGWCFHPQARITDLAIKVDDDVHPVIVHGMPRIDVYEACRGDDPHGFAKDSGFWAFVPISGPNAPTVVRIELRARLDDGRTIEQHLGIVLVSLDVVPRFPLPVLPGHDAARSPLVAICMATYNPRFDLFERQIASIRAQTHTNWICIISDDCSRPDIEERIRRMVGEDPRFYYYHNAKNLGFYRNFEQCLTLVPEEATFVALADQDDYWYPDKMATLLMHFRPDTTLVYSDMHLVSEKGRILARSFWPERPNNYTHLVSLVLANTITGAASMFRRCLLAQVLPFPERVGNLFHDQWIGVVALSIGPLAFVDRPLYDYVQHGTNAIGYQGVYRNKVRTFREQLTAIRNGQSAPPGVEGAWRREVGKSMLEAWREIYGREVLRIAFVARTLELRCGAHLSRWDRQKLKWVAGAGSSLPGLAWLVLRVLRSVGRTNAAVGVEFELLKGVIWTRHVRQHEMYVQILYSVFPDWLPQPETPESAKIDIVRRKTAPLALHGTDAAPRRLNLLVSTIDIRYFFGGYITLFTLALRLQADGWDVRIITVDPCEPLTASEERRIEAHGDLRDFFGAIEIIHTYDRSVVVDVHPDDVFVATSWWTAHIAHQAAKDMGRRRFIYLIQEYEPMFYSMGTWASLAQESYTFSHYAIFSTEILREYFRTERIGVFAADAEAGEQTSISFCNPITDMGNVTTDELATRVSRRVLFYARPEDHAARNMFEIGVLALKAAVAAGTFDGRWEFYGIGKLEQTAKIPLGKGFVLQMLPRQDEDAYRALARACDIGVSLMDTPHPSLVPIEMASAGMVVVTTTCATKTREALAAISENLIGVKPTIAAVAGAIGEAVVLVDGYRARAAGARVRWSRSGTCSFDVPFLRQVRAFGEALR